MEFRKKLPISSQQQEGQERFLITNRPGISGIAGVVEGSLIQFDVLWIFFLDFLSDSFDQGLEYNTIAGYRSAISAFHVPVDLL